MKIQFSVITALLLLSWVIPSGCISYVKVDVSDPEKQVDNATLIVMAYPEVVCRTTEAFYSNLLPLVGIGKKQLIRAGHACLVVAREGEEKLEYFDNGRYITPVGYCRVRGENTDPELRVDVKARWNGKKLANIDEILQWFYDHPEKTHGGGTLYAGISEEANYQATMECINFLQDQNIMEYGPFAEGGTNCARFVTDAIYNGVVNPEIKEDIEDLYNFTPSGLSNIRASNSYDYYYVVDGKGVRTSDKSLNTIQLRALFDGGKGYSDYSPYGALCPPENITTGEDWQWLGGMGYGAWYVLEPTEEKGVYRGSCYTAKGEMNYSALYRSPEGMDLGDSLEITYPSNYEMFTVESGNRRLTLEKVS